MLGQAVQVAATGDAGAFSITCAIGPGDDFGSIATVVEGGLDGVGVGVGVGIGVGVGGGVIEAILIGGAA